MHRVVVKKSHAAIAKASQRRDANRSLWFRSDPLCLRLDSHRIVWEIGGFARSSLTFLKIAIANNSHP